MPVTTAQLPQPPRGADRVIAASNAVIVLDGASAIEPASVPPGIYADHLGASIAAALTARPEAALTSALAEAIEAAAGTLGLAGESCPSSTVAMARVTRDGADLLVLGDSFIFYDTGPGAGVLTDDRLAELRLPNRAATASAWRPGAATTTRTGRCCALSSVSSVSTATAQEGTGSRKRPRLRPGRHELPRCPRPPAGWCSPRTAR